MTTATTTAIKSNSDVLAIFTAVFLGAAMIFFAGFAQSSTLHDAAHDTRHVTGFPCH